MEKLIKQGTLVKYSSAEAGLERYSDFILDACAAESAASSLAPGAAYCYLELNWSFVEIESNLTGIVLETRGSKEVKVKWFGINKTFMEHEEYLEIVK